MDKVKSVGIVLFCLTYGYAQTQVDQFAISDASFREFLARWEQAQARFINGDPASWKENVLQTDDTTIFGAFGGYEKGWKQVSERNDWASSQFQEGGIKKPFEYLNIQTSGDLAFTVAIERDVVRMHNQTQPVSRALRVTQIFRKVDGNWKLLHRHADPMLEKKAPSADSPK